VLGEAAAIGGFLLCRLPELTSLFAPKYGPLISATESKHSYTQDDQSDHKHAD
jgi:hypothetical protein